MKKLSFFITFTLSFILSFSKTGYYRLIIQDNPAFSFTLAWCQLSGENPVVFYDTKQHYDKDSSFRFKISKVKFVHYKGMTNAFVKLAGLQPDTKYVVKIIDSDSQSPTFWFKTLPIDPEQKISIIAGGDSRSHPHIRRMANRMVAKLQPDFVIFDGDFTFHAWGIELRKWLKDWQLTIYNNHLIPILIVPGNHEKLPDLQALFNIAQNGYYALPVGLDFLKIIVLNTQFQIPGTQTQWLENQLKQTRDKTWTIAVYHKPIRPHYSGKSQGTQQYKYWAGLFYDYKVDLAVEGDTHTHKITYRIKPDSAGYQGFKRSDKGTVFIGEGTWGAPLRPADDIKPWTFDAAKINQFKWLWIDKNQIQIRTVLYTSQKQTQQLSPDSHFKIPKGIKLRVYPDSSTVFTVKNQKIN